MLTLTEEQVAIVRQALIVAGMELRANMRRNIADGFEILAGDLAKKLVRHEHAEHIMFNLESHFIAVAKESR